MNPAEENQKPTGRRAAQAVLSMAGSSVEPAKPHKPWQQVLNGTHQKNMRLASSGLLVLFLLFTAQLVWFSNHALPGSYLGNEPVGLKSRKQIQAHANQSAADYKVLFTDQYDKTRELPAATVGAVLDPEKTVNEFFKEQARHPFGILAFWQKPKHIYSYNFDKAKVAAFAEKQKHSTTKHAQDAVLSIDAGKAKILPELAATEKVFGNAEAELASSLSNGRASHLKFVDRQIKPAVTAAQLEPIKQHVQELIDTDLTLSLGWRRVSPDATQKASWLNIDNKKTDASSVSFDELKVQSYLDGVAETFTSPPRARVVINLDNGETKTLVEGEDGITITDKTGIAKQMIDILESKRAGQIDLAVTTTERKTIIAGDYPKWLQADLTNHRLYAYEHGTLVKTILMSAGAPGTPTVVGQFKILYKVRMQTMRGLNADGTGYVQPNVEWINYFYQDYAIHGNYWRPASVFGNLNTSHGCVGMPDDEAKWVYDWAPVGTPVITYY